MKQRIIRHFNQGASTYDSSADVQAYVAKQLISRMHTLPTKILEIGCGTGLLSQHLISLFPHASLLLTDIAPNMVDTCHNRFNHYSHIQIKCMDGESIMSDTKFDLITSSMTLHWFENLKLSLQNLMNKLVSGGTLSFAMLGKESLHEWRDLCMHEELSVATLPFPDQNTIKIDFPDLTLESEIFQTTYTNTYAFLNSLKRLGARAPYGEHKPTSPSKMRDVIRRYSSEITMTYEIIYGCYVKP